jgi:hypothetical protein
VRTQSHKIASDFRCYLQVVGCHLPIWLIGCKPVLVTPSSGSMGRSQNSEKYFTCAYIYIRCTYKRYYKWTVRWRRWIDKIWEKTWRFQTLFRCAILWKPPCAQLTEPSPFSFLCRLQHKHDWLHHWPLTNSAFNPTYLPRCGKKLPKVPTLSHGCFSTTRSHPGVIQKPTKSHLIRTKDCPIFQEILKDLGTFCQKPEKKTKLDNICRDRYISM